MPASSSAAPPLYLCRRNGAVVLERVRSRGCVEVRGDAKLPSALDYTLTWSLGEELCSGCGLWLAGGLVLIERVPKLAASVDYAAALYSYGHQVAVAAYWVDGGWRFYPRGAAAAILSRLTSLLEVRARGHVKGKKLRLGVASGYALLRLGGYAAVAECRSGVCKVRDAAPASLAPARASVEELLDSYSRVLDSMLEGAKRFIASRASSRVAVAFSGGADSTLALALAAEALGRSRVVAVYSDTGMEYDATLRVVERVASELNVDLVVVGPGEEGLAKLVSRYGLPGRDRRWCTEHLKLRPLAGALERMGIRVVVDGARSFESTSRARLRRIERQPLARAKRLLPLLEWRRVEVELALMKLGLPLNPLYELGFRRIGCVVCPAKHLYEIRLSASATRADWVRVVRLLADSLGVSAEWLEEQLLSGSWRDLGLEPRVGGLGRVGQASSGDS